MNKKTMMAHVATLIAALDYVAEVDSNGFKITPELLGAVSELIGEMKQTFDFDGETFETFADAQAALFERLTDSGVEDVTGQYF
jgi:hypothetical protein